MKPPMIIIVILCIVITIGILIYFFNHKAIILRRLKALPFSKIGSLQNNKFAKIEGIALNIDAPLIAPLSKRKCVFYKITIQKKVNNGKNSHWKTVVNEIKIQDFFIEQSSERLIVFPTSYKDYLVIDNKANSGTFNDPSPKFRSLLESYNIETEGIFGMNKSLRYTEAIVEVGERITVAGLVKWSKLENPVAGYNYSSIASLTSKDKNKIIITDSPDALRTKHGRV
ncbi:hypothetical protein [Olleya sp. ITB9]|uniref:hypothetical protein n=1 Tax=Olleya sp. ITB9 TaxID=1715648 RepID=UPI0006D0CBA2|nr:hypothetical protein [Olleya sp. ITB9]